MLAAATPVDAGGRRMTFSSARKRKKRRERSWRMFFMAAGWRGSGIGGREIFEQL
jgi:hypothetical protein